MQTGKVYWLFGNSGAGKTTLARQIQENLPGIIHLDGDELRTIWQLGFSQEDRWEQNRRAARLAKILAKQNLTILVTVICPYRELRTELNEICKPTWFYLPGGREPTAEYPFEPPASDEAIWLKPIPGTGNFARVLKLINHQPNPLKLPAAA